MNQPSGPARAHSPCSPVVVVSVGHIKVIEHGSTDSCASHSGQIGPCWTREHRQHRVDSVEQQRPGGGLLKLLGGNVTGQPAVQPVGARRSAATRQLFPLAPRADLADWLTAREKLQVGVRAWCVHVCRAHRREVDGRIYPDSQINVMIGTGVACCSFT
jgi:hypothetical protein